MDRALSLSPWALDPTRPVAADAAAALILPSRSRTLERLGQGLAHGPGLWLLTGEPGAGKSWLIERLRGGAVPGLRGLHWASVDLAAGTTPADLLSAIGHALGLEQATAGSLEPGRQALASFLSDEQTEGRRWVLTIDEAHLATVEVLEELRILGNRLGRRDGLAALILVGQTPLARRLQSQRALRSLESRLAGHVHLGPIDADEAGLLLAAVEPSLARRLPGSRLETLHRDAGGNPCRLIRDARLELLRDPALAAPRPPAPARPASPMDHAATATPVVAPAPTTAVRPGPGPILPARPPLHVGEGLIEVGWESDAEPVGPVADARVLHDLEASLAEAHRPDADHALDLDLDLDTDESTEAFDDLVRADTPLDELTVHPYHEVISSSLDEDEDELDDEAGEIDPALEARLGVEEPIDDHYTTLQAWSEWAARQGRAPVETPESTGQASTDDGAQPSDTLPQRRNVWAEGEQEFAPYSQLFARSRRLPRNSGEE